MSGLGGGGTLKSGKRGVDASIAGVNVKRLFFLFLTARVATQGTLTLYCLSVELKRTDRRLLKPNILLILYSRVTANIFIHF